MGRTATPGDRAPERETSFTEVRTAAKRAQKRNDRLTEELARTRAALKLAVKEAFGGGA